MASCASPQLPLVAGLFLQLRWAEVGRPLPIAGRTVLCTHQFSPSIVSVQELRSSTDCELASVLAALPASPSVRCPPPQAHPGAGR